MLEFLKLNPMKKTVISIVATLSILSILSLLHVKLTTDITEMLPLKDPVIADQYRVLTAFNSMEKVIFDISINDCNNFVVFLNTKVGFILTKTIFENSFIPFAKLRYLWK